MNKLLIVVFAIQLNLSFAQVNQNGAAPSTEGEQNKSSTVPASKKEQLSPQGSDLKTKETDSQQIESAVSTYSISRNSAKQSRTSRTPSSFNQSQMDKSVDVLKKSSPNSYEFHIFAYLAGNYDISLIDHLTKAEKLQPNAFDVLAQKAAYHIIKNEESKSLSYLQKLVDEKKITSDVINYVEDVLRSVPQNGVLITHGFDDSYAANYLQLKKDVRTDVKVISLDFLQSEYLRSQLKKEGLKMPDRVSVDVDFLKQFVTLNSSSKLAISATVPKEYLTGISSKLFITGLVFTYSEADYDNYTRNKELWNQELKKYGINNVESERGKQLSANYLPMLLQIANSGAQLNQDVSDIDKMIDKVAKLSNKTEQVKKLKSY